MIRVSAGAWDGDPRVVDRTLAHQGRRVKHISGFSGFSPRGPWKAPAFVGFMQPCYHIHARRSLLSFRRADWESSSGASDWFAGGMEVPELFLSTTVAWKHYASYLTKSFRCFVAVYQLQASRQGGRGFRFFAENRAADISPGLEH